MSFPVLQSLLEAKVPSKDERLKGCKCSGPLKRDVNPKCPIHGVEKLKEAEGDQKSIGVSVENVVKYNKINAMAVPSRAVDMMLDMEEKVGKKLEDMTRAEVIGFLKDVDLSLINTVMYVSAAIRIARKQ